MRNPTSGAGAAPDVHGFVQMDTARAGQSYYFAGCFGVYSAGSTFTYTADIINAMPMVFARDTTLTGLHVYTQTAAAGKVIRLGIYDAINDDTNLYPNSLIIDAGTVDVSAPTALKSIVISQKLTGGKLYWLASVSNSSVVVTYTAATYNFWPILGWDNTLSNRGGTGWYATFAYAALPATFPTVGSAVYGDVDLPGLVYSMS